MLTWSAEVGKILFLPSLTPKDLLSMTSHQYLQSQGPLLDICAKQCMGTECQGGPDEPGTQERENWLLTWGPACLLLYGYIRLQSMKMHRPARVISEGGQDGEPSAAGRQYCSNWYGRLASQSGVFPNGGDLSERSKVVINSSGSTLYQGNFQNKRGINKKCILSFAKYMWVSW